MGGEARGEAEGGFAPGGRGGPAADDCHLRARQQRRIAADEKGGRHPGHRRQLRRVTGVVYGDQAAVRAGKPLEVPVDSGRIPRSRTPQALEPANTLIAPVFWPPIPLILGPVIGCSWRPFPPRTDTINDSANQRANQGRPGFPRSRRNFMRSLGTPADPVGALVGRAANGAREVAVVSPSGA